MHSKPLLIANWKMNKSLSEASDFFSTLFEFLESKNIDENDCDFLIAPSFLCLSSLASSYCEKLAAQNCHYAENGAFTGEVSIIMLKEFGIKNVILGHSERRQYFQETDDSLALKVQACEKSQMSFIFCVGESLEQRNANKTFSHLESQLTVGLKNLTSTQNLTIAYEPIWAIGTGLAATSEQAQEVHKFIRNWLSNRFDSKIAKKIRLLYGGSVTPENIISLINQPDIEGALIGGASLKPESFGKIIELSCKKQ